MIKINDNRKKQDRMLKDIELDGFFVFGGVLCRRVDLPEDIFYKCDGIPYIQMPNALVDVMNGNTWVKPVRDECIAMSIEDWG